jgi:hypothetical protein
MNSAIFIEDEDVMVGVEVDVEDGDYERVGVH